MLFAADLYTFYKKFKNWIKMRVSEKNITISQAKDASVMVLTLRLRSNGAEH